jgi:hypothetical protein
MCELFGFPDSGAHQADFGLTQSDFRFCGYIRPWRALPCVRCVARWKPLTKRCTKQDFGLTQSDFRLLDGQFWMNSV